MRFLLIALLLASCLCAETAVTRAYTDYLKKHVEWEVVDYEDNIFKGWTDEEVNALFGDHMDYFADMIADPNPIDTKYMPESLDWSDDACTHEIRNQGQCGSCWTFSVAGVVSDRCCKAGQDHGWLAPQELLSCDKSNDGCNGGDRTAAMNFVAQKGLVHEACFPYVAKEAPCPKTCADGKEWNASHVCKCTNVRHCDGEKGIISCLATGPVAVGMLVYADFMYYKGGIYKWDHKSAYRGAHAIRLVGYGPDFWKCANSWGTAWGEQGFFRIGKGECNIETRSPVVCDPK